MRVSSVRAFALISLTLLLVTQPANSATDSPADTGYSISVLGGRVPVSINLDVQQNLTLVQKSFTMPAISAVLSGSNASSVSQLVQESLKAMSANARVDSLQMRAISSNWSNQVGTNASIVGQWFNVSLSFDVLGVQTATGGFQQTDLTWKSFNVLQNIPIGGVEVNNIGKYLIAPATAEGDKPISTTVRSIFRVNRGSVAGRNWAFFAGQINILNFTKLSPPASSWVSKYDVGSNELSWSLGLNNLGITETQVFQEPGMTESLTYVAIYSIQATISAPRKTTISGNLLTTSMNDLAETIMSLTVLFSTAAGIGAFVYERRILEKLPKRRPKR